MIKSKIYYSNLKKKPIYRGKKIFLLSSDVVGKTGIRVYNIRNLNGMDRFMIWLLHFFAAKWIYFEGDEMKIYEDIEDEK